MKQLAETFDAVIGREFIETDGIYKATILDDDLTDFNQNDFLSYPCFYRMEERYALRSERMQQDQNLLLRF